MIKETITCDRCYEKIEEDEYYYWHYSCGKEACNGGVARCTKHKNYDLCKKCFYYINEYLDKQFK